MDDSASCAKCLYVNRDFLRRRSFVERGDEGWKSCEEDIVVDEIFFLPQSQINSMIGKPYERERSQGRT